MIPALLTGFGPRVLSWLLRLGFGGAVDKALDFMKARADRQTEEKRIRSMVTIETIRAEVAQHREDEQTKRHLASEGTTRQQAKMNHKVFWVIIVAALGPGVLNMWTLWVYNIFFWKDGIWPQPWAIAQYPPQAAVWVNMSIEWLFDPAGIGSTVGVATIAGRFTGKSS